MPEGQAAVAGPGQEQPRADAALWCAVQPAQRACCARCAVLRHLLSACVLPAAPVKTGVILSDERRHDWVLGGEGRGRSQVCECEAGGSGRLASQVRTSYTPTCHSVRSVGHTCCGWRCAHIRRDVRMEMCRCYVIVTIDSLPPGLQHTHYRVQVLEDRAGTV